MARLNYRRQLILSHVIAIGCALLSVCPASFAQGADLPKMISPPHEVSSHFFGVNIENSYMSPPILSWTDPMLQRAIKKAGIEAIRFPGGDVGNYWDWQKGTVYPMGKASQTQDSLNALLDLSRATGAYPIYSLNVMTLNNAVLPRANLSQGVANQLRMLDAARGMKLPVEDLELGNEFFWSSPDHDRAFPTAADYATDMNQWTARLRQDYPHANIAAVGSIPSSGDARTKNWNEAVVGKIHDVDAITLHRYDSIVDGGVWDGTAPDAVLSNVFTDWEKIVSGEVHPIEKARLRLWVTEFSGFKDCTSNARFTGTWLEALYQAQMAIQFLSTPSVDQIELYNMTGSTGSLMFQNTSSYWNACQNKSMTFHATAGDLTATGQAYALFGGALKQATSVSALAFPETSMVHPKSGTPYPSVTGIALRGETSQWIIVNLSSKPQTLKYPGMGQGTMESINAPSLTTIVDSEHVLSHGTHAFDGRHFVLPPFSVNRIVVKHPVH
ncbi:hypothetical protein [Dyella sp. GSA-30]|uniref:hypothetical protein n=1 Tax=Dyella sp. GSA-30 TaxID=2994496 RepID=UPI0024912CE8|nr:hypothetical protein [Dyella sp. GSA-30]BDU21167.1 hypothetical protein DYGSA30_26240 [Dyella sp. GSA-30]